jgi:hypothetical protein
MSYTEDHAVAYIVVWTQQTLHTTIPKTMTKDAVTHL